MMIILKRLAMVVSAAAILAVLNGCGLSPPADDIQVIVRKKLTDKQAKRVKSKLKGIDKGVTKIRHVKAGGRLTVTLAPVADVEAFADKLDLYGRVTVSGRVIILEPKPGWP